jgi:hypothetical protein
MPDEFPVNLMLRLVYENNTPMDLNQALEFLERYGFAIARRWQQLRYTTEAYTSEYQDYLMPRFAFPRPKIEVRAMKPYVPWASILSNYRFDGADAIHRDAQFTFRTSNNLATPHSKKRNVAANHGQAHHEMLGNLESLAALNLISAPGGPSNKAKRASKRWNIAKKTEGPDDVFKVAVTSHYFHNDIVHQKCGTDHYTGNTESNKQGCKKYLNGIVDRVTDRLGSSC